MAALLEYQNDSGYLGIEIDAAEREGYAVGDREHAVEYGAAVVDHLRRNADTITLECIVTNAPGGAPLDAHGRRDDAGAAHGHRRRRQDPSREPLRPSGPFDRGARGGPSP